MKNELGQSFSLASARLSAVNNMVKNIKIKNKGASGASVSRI